MNGILNLNKPKGVTSTGVLNRIKARLRVRRAGHAGTLDSHASGVLVLGLGKATRLLPYIMDLDKEYLATVRLGVQTDTLDPEGEVVARAPVPELEPEELRAVLDEFKGEIEQIPPSYSAKRLMGQRLYHLAREGIHVRLKPKRVVIQELELVDFEDDRLKIRVVCGKGTYIRSLARDIGLRLGTVGMVEELVRLRVGHFSVRDSVDPDDPELATRLLPPDSAVLHLPEVWVSPRARGVFVSGGRVPKRHITRFPKAQDLPAEVRVYQEEGGFLGVGVLSWDGLHPRRVVA